jgi:four helix bundle protein
MSSYKELIVWQKSIQLVTDIYKLTKTFPKEEIYGLASQMQRAVVSIPSNIAEGNDRNSSKEFSQFLRIARGSLAELETQIIISEKLGYTDKGQITPILNSCYEIGRMINGLLTKFN